MFFTIYLYKNLMKLPQQNPGKYYLPTGMAYRAPDAIALQKMAVLGTRLFVPTRVRSPYEKENQVLAQMQV